MMLSAYYWGRCHTGLYCPQTWSVPSFQDFRTDPLCLSTFGTTAGLYIWVWKQVDIIFLCNTYQWHVQSRKSIKCHHGFLSHYIALICLIKGFTGCSCWRVCQNASNYYETQIIASFTLSVFIIASIRNVITTCSWTQSVESQTPLITKSVSADTIIVVEISCLRLPCLGTHILQGNDLKTFKKFALHYKL